MSEFLKVKKSIDEYLTYYKDEQSIKDWLKNNNLIVTKDSAENILNKANECMLNKAKSVLMDLLDFYDESIVTNDNLASSINLEDTFKSNIVSGGILGALGASILLGPPGWIVGAFVGAMCGIAHNNNKYLKYIVESIIKNQYKIVEDVKRKCIPILDKLIIEEEKVKNLFLIPHVSETVSYEYQGLSYEQLMLKKFLENRNIKHLIHVTDSRNVESIMRYGLLPKTDLKRLNISFVENDLKRLEEDGMRAVCLSVSRQNLKLINKFKYNGTMKNEVILYIDATVLWKEISIRRKYCQTNAVTNNSCKGSSLSDFEKLFDEQIEYVKSDGEYCIKKRNQFYLNNITTDPQAEILFYGKIDPKYISMNKSTFDPYIVTSEDLPF